MPKLQSNNTKKVLGYLAICIVGTLIAALLSFSSVLEELENRTWDWRLKLTAHIRIPDPRIKIIVVDQSSLDSLAREEKIFWPWPRGIYEAVVRFLTLGGAKVAAFDVLFTEQSSYGIEDDTSFSSAVADSLPVISALALRRSSNEIDPQRLGALRERSLQLGHKIEIAQFYANSSQQNLYPGITLPISELITASAGFGNVSTAPDSDGIFRHTSIGSYFKDIPILGLPFAIYERVTSENLESSFLGEAMDAQGRLAVRFTGPARSYKTYSVASIIKSYQQISEGQTPQIDPSEFAASLVLIGVDAPGLLDLRPTPLSEVFPGVEFNATVLDNLLNKNFVIKSSQVWNIFVAFCLIACVSAVCTFCRRLPIQIIGLLFVAAIYFGLQYYLALNGIWLNFMAPFVGALLGVGASLAFQFQLEGRQHRFIKDAFKYYVSPEVIDQIVSNPASLAIGGERRELTIFFSDIAGFTSISESIEPNKLVLLLNEFLSAMTEIIMQHGGTVDKYVGDAIIAFWNAPLSIEEHAAQALSAAIACQEKLAHMQVEFNSKYSTALRMRVGLNTGVVSVGNFGSKERFNYTIIGDAVNLASRLEGANKYFGTSILISGSTFEMAKGSVPCRKLGDIKVVGKSKVIPVYEPMVDALSKFTYSADFIAQFAQGRECFERGQLEQAASYFSHLKNDPVSICYLKRIEIELRSSNGLPLENWSPVWNLSEK